MKLKKVIAGIVVSAISVSTFVVPVNTSAPDMLKSDISMIAEAAEKTVETDYTLTASSSTKDDAPNKVRVVVPMDATTVTFNFETEYTKEISMGIFGAETYKAPDYWSDIKESFTINPEDGKASYTYKIPKDIQGNLKRICLGLWYPESGVTVNITSITHDGSKILNVLDGPQEKPETANNKSGAWTFKDNKDGTATISSTLTVTAETPKHKRILSSDAEEGTNAQRIAIKDFGIEDDPNIVIESFNFKLSSQEDIKTFTYGGGISVEAESAADTENAKGSGSAWYNDQSEEDAEKYSDKLDALGIKYNTGGYEVKNAGTYADVVWDVPKDVQKYVSKKDGEVSVQLWSAELLNPDEDDPAPAELELGFALCTYTKTITVPYTKTVNQKIGEKVTVGKKYKFNLSKLGLTSRCYASAVKFNFSAAYDTNEIQIGLGASIADTLPDYKGWYSAPNVSVIDPNTKKTELMWLIPEDIMKHVYYGEKGTLDFAVYYAGEKKNNTITLESIDFYEYITAEEDIELEDFEMLVGDKKKLDINVKGFTIETSDESIATVTEDGTITAVALGEAVITVKTPEGQSVDVNVNVVKELSPVTTKPPVTTQPPVTTVSGKVTTVSGKVTTGSDKTTVKTDKTETTQTMVTTTPGKEVPGDVTLDGKVNLADLVRLNNYLVKKADIKYAEAIANADIVKDGKVNVFDAVALRRMLLKKK